MIALHDLGGDDATLGLPLDQTLNDSVDHALDTAVDDSDATPRVIIFEHTPVFSKAFILG